MYKLGASSKIFQDVHFLRLKVLQIPVLSASILILVILDKFGKGTWSSEMNRYEPLTSVDRAETESTAFLTERVGRYYLKNRRWIESGQEIQTYPDEKQDTSGIYLLEDEKVLILPCDKRQGIW